MTSSMRATPSLRIINRSKPSATPEQPRQPVAHRRKQAAIVRGNIAAGTTPQLDIGGHAMLHHVGVGEFVVAVRHFYTVDDQLEAGRYGATV